MGILDDILNYSKLEAGKLVLEHSDFELSLVMVFLKGVATPLLKDKPVSLNFDIDPAVPEVLKGDALRLGQVLLNLLTNAIKFTSEGSVTLKIQLLGLEDQQARVYFAVIDTGIGLDLEEQALLFKAFHQADTTTTRLYGGSGLGLAICKELVEAMGGEIIIDSQKDLGACFSFSVNLELSASASASARLYKFPGLRNTRVLVVEDNEIIQEFIPDIMGYEGVQVDLASNGEEALVLLAANDYAVVLMDLQMPVMDGFETTSRIRKDSRFAKVPIIAMTGNVFDQERQRCLDCGMNDFISKPVEWEQAFETLERWVVDPQGQSFASLGRQAKAV